MSQPSAAVADGRLAEIAHGLVLAVRRFGTPLHVTDVATLDAAAAELTAAFPDPWIRQYSLKANDVTAVVRLLAERGFGANVVSRGEWAIARRAGLPDRFVTFEGVGKADADLRAAVVAAREGHPPRWIAVESVEEAEVLGRIAVDRPSPPAQPLGVLFRLNPDVLPETLPGLAVGAGGSKFGMTETEIGTAIDVVAASPLLRPRGLHLHVGSQLLAIDAWRDAARRGLALLALLRGNLQEFDTLDLGGGFPVAPFGSSGPRPERFAREIAPLLAAIPEDRRPRRLAVEPGRFLVARAGWLLARVLHARERGRPQVVLDAGMTELIRPALYGARHPIVALIAGGRPTDVAPAGVGAAGTALAASSGARPTLVEGPVCESTDHLGEHLLPPLVRGDVVAIGDAGAYAASFSSTYNGRPRPAQVLLEPDGRLVLARRRGRPGSLA